MKKDTRNHIKYMQQTLEIAKNSPDPSTKVGALLVSPDETEIFTGFNRFPPGIPDKAQWWNNRDSASGEFSKYDLVCCAELMAILNSTSALKDFTLYTSHFPCLSCARTIAAVEISHVYYHFSKEHIAKNIDEVKVRTLFKLASIELIHLSNIE
ncbi:MAG: cytidine deaminase [Spirochaetales bacterium]|nr:cytidine deaminase [Spirochaetales bacterium]